MKEYVKIAGWCNGSTPHFGCGNVGSNPTPAAKIDLLMNNKEIRKLTSFLFEIGNLRKVIRSHQQLLLSYDLSDTIASHTFRVSMISYFLAKELGADENKALKMALIHDVEETRSMDHHWVSKKYVKVFEDEIRQAQFKELPYTDEFKKLSEEYYKKESLEAKIVKDADLLDEIFLLCEYAWQGNKEAMKWLKIGKREENIYERMLFTNIAKEIAKEVKKQPPSLWWQNIWTPYRRK